MYWANFIHIYQPPTQKEIWVRRITNESYRKIFTGLLKIKRARITININGILCELLEKYGGQDVLDNIRTLLKYGTIELTGSAKYHAFLPLLPKSEIERQILLNEATLKKYFGSAWKKSGFFPPEMAYSRKVAEVAAGMGYKWIINDELAFPAAREKKTNTIYAIEGLDNFDVFFRERNLSFLILSAQIGTVKAILKYMDARLHEDGYAITGMDGETFGHHRPGLEMLLFDLLQEKSITPVTISELRSKFADHEIIQPRDSTWAATREDMEGGTPFSRWKRDDNVIQQKQWQLTDLAIGVANRDSQNLAGRQLLDEALHSDQYWWASARPWWSLEMMERGAHELKTIVLQSPGASAQERNRAEELYKQIIYTALDWQRSGLVDEISRKEDEEIRSRLEEKEKLFITTEEYGRMIRTLKREMRLAALSKDYHRAAMISDRIRELQEEKEKRNA